MKMRIHQIVMLGWVVAAAWLCGGCEKPLFPENMPRTQYERYDRFHGRYVPAEKHNVYGGTEPDLRARLSPSRS